MIKSVISVILTLFAALLVFVGTKIGIARILENLLYFAGPVVTFAILAAGLFVFFVFFAARFFTWYNSEPQTYPRRNQWTISPAQSLNLLLGLAALIVMYDALAVVLTLAEQINDYFLWLFFLLFMSALFFSAFQKDRLEKRSNRNQANWWRG